MEHYTDHAASAEPHRGARKKYGERQLTVRITKDMDDILRDQARAEGLDMADVVRRALTRGLAPVAPAASAEASGDRTRAAPLPA